MSPAKTNTNTENLPLPGSEENTRRNKEEQKGIKNEMQEEAKHEYEMQQAK